MATLTARRLPYEPAFDGLRGAAVMAVLLFHGGFSWAAGGFLGVSTFFTLSGFLITSLLLGEHDAEGRVSMKRFWSRRVRRLWPATALTLLLTALLATTVVTGTGLVGLRGDMVAAQFDVSNWWFIHEGRSYGALFRAPSMVQQFWSLAIEEQFYLLVPPLLALLFTRVASRSHRAIAVGAAIAVSAAWTLVLDSRGANVDRIYYGSETRALEILAGVLLAVLVHGHTFSPGARDRIVGVGAAALGASVAAWSLVSQGDSWLYRGGLWAYAAVSVAVVLACREDGLARSALTWKPLVRLGEISFGVYLLHWPIFRWLTPERLGRGLEATFLVRLAVTVGAAALSAWLLERPIRNMRGPFARPWVPRVLGVTSFAAVLAVTLTLVPTAPAGFDIDKASEELARAIDQPVQPKLGAPLVAGFGDSTALAFMLGAARWAERSGEIRIAPGAADLGCGLIDEGGRRASKDDEPGDIDERCHDRRRLFREQAGNTDYAVMMVGPWEVFEHRLPGDRRWRVVGDPIIDAELRQKANEAIDDLSSGGAHVLWILSPPMAFGTESGTPPRRAEPESDPARMERLNQIIREEAAKRPDDVTVLDLPAWLATQPGGKLALDMRPDGVHFSQIKAMRVARLWLWPEIQRVRDSAPG